jgi:hypothetical protein
MRDADYRYVERYRKFLLWSIGGFKVYICGCSEIAKKLQQAYSVAGERAFDYDFVQKKRCENYLSLSELLPDSNPFTKTMPSCPFAYPYHHADGVALRKYLASQNIFVPTNWSYLLKTMPEDSLEYSWSADILPLPVDQRYGREEMEIIAEAVRSFEK